MSSRAHDADLGVAIGMVRTCDVDIGSMTMFSTSTGSSVKWSSDHVIASSHE